MAAAYAASGVMLRCYGSAALRYAALPLWCFSARWRAAAYSKKEIIQDHPARNPPVHAYLNGLYQVTAISVLLRMTSRIIANGDIMEQIITVLRSLIIHLQDGAKISSNCKSLHFCYLFIQTPGCSQCLGGWTSTGKLQSCGLRSLVV
ncbi:hypothetical protein NPIL_107721 [Nephila pilipes]|uniref:Uncharacterized protein n=1 Tax=Nephila pilipes TaxID=299642 RepID=A0A8X6R5U7_NEPPI|nr:hypothetical protein NPIL_107721 [Nephila pilipes]